MGFRELDNISVANTASSAPRVTISLRQRNAGAPVLCVGINAAGLAEAGLTAGDRLRVLMGEGDMRGRVRLVKDDKGAFTASPFKGARKSKAQGRPLSAVLRIVDAAFTGDKREKRPARWGVVEGGGIEIELPPGFLLAVPAAAIAQPPRAVTAGLMGDPPLARSALAGGKR